MNVRINFSAEIETALLRRAAIAGTDVETVIQELVAERLEEESTPPAKPVSHDDFMDKLRAIIALHPRSNGSMDDRRESIYAGRGE